MKKSITRSKFNRMWATVPLNKRSCFASCDKWPEEPIKYVHYVTRQSKHGHFMYSKVMTVDEQGGGVDYFYRINIKELF